MRASVFVIGLAAAVLLGACASTDQVHSANVATTAATAANGASGVSNPTRVNVATQRPSNPNSSLDCREERRTGTHFSRRNCMTERERQEMRDQAQEWMRSGGLNGSTMQVQ